MDVSHYKRMIKAFQIFDKYLQNELDSDNSLDPFGSISAEHDIIYAGPNPKLVSEDDIDILDELEWTADYDYECFNYFT